MEAAGGGGRVGVVERPCTVFDVSATDTNEFRPHNDTVLCGVARLSRRSGGGVGIALQETNDGRVVLGSLNKLLHR